MRKILIALGTACTLALGTGADLATSAGTPKGGVDRIMTDVYVQVIQRVDLGNWYPIQIGIAHVQVHAYDVDPLSPRFQVGQTADEGWVSCEPVGSPQCSVLPNGGARTDILWVDMTGTDTQTVSVSAGSDFLVLHDGGTPGSGVTGATSDSGAAETSDYLRWGNWRGRPSFDAWVLSGNVTINRG